MHLKTFFAVLLGLACMACVGKKEQQQEVPKEGAMVQSTISPTGGNSALPFLFSNSKITLMSWVEQPNDSLSVLKYAQLQNGAWQKPKEIIQGTDWFVNWADFPAIAENKGNLFTHVLKKSSEGTYSYDVKLNLLPKDSTHWQNDLSLHTDDTPTEHGFVTALAYGEGFFVSWLDGRNTEEKDDGTRGAMTIRAAEVSPTGALTNERELDARTCDCCQTTAAITANGPVVVYRDRFKDETRDISIVRRVSGEWTMPKPIYQDNWKIKGCPVNGPKASAIDNTLAVAWFTAADNKPIVKVVFSDDGGENFDAPITISDTGALGRVDLLLLDEQTALVSYMESTEGRATLKSVKVKRSGQVMTPRVVTTLDASRKTGFPQMELVGGNLYFAWTHIDDAGTEVKTAYLELDAI